MAEKRTYRYEAMFLLGQSALSDFGGAVAHIKEVLARGHADIIALRKWDERRLAYEVNGQKRGVYFLVYFSAPSDGVAHIERDCNLSETILRTIILRADHLSDDEMKAADGRADLETEIKMRASMPVPAAPAPAAPAPAPAEPSPAG